MSDLAALMALGTINYDTVTIEGKTFRICSLSAGQRDALHIAAEKTGSMSDHLVAAHGLVDGSGKPLGVVEDVAKALEGLHGAVVYKIAKAVLKLSKFGEGALEAAEKK